MVLATIYIIYNIIIIPLIWDLMAMI